MHAPNIGGGVNLVISAGASDMAQSELLGPATSLSSGMPEPAVLSDFRQAANGSRALSRSRSRSCSSLSQTLSSASSSSSFSPSSPKIPKEAVDIKYPVFDTSLLTQDALLAFLKTPIESSDLFSFCVMRAMAPPYF